MATSSPLGQGMEDHAGMIEAIAHGHQFAAPVQQVVDGLLDFQDVDVHYQIGILLAQALDGPWHQELRDAGHGGEREDRGGAALEGFDGMLEVLHLSVDVVDLIDDAFGFRGRDEATVAAGKQPHAEHRLGVLHDPAYPRGGNVEKTGRTIHGACHHDGPDHLDLPQGQHDVPRSGKKLMSYALNTFSVRCC